MARPAAGVLPDLHRLTVCRRVLELLLVFTLAAQLCPGPAAGHVTKPLDAVIATLEKALKKDRNNPDLWTTLGVAYVSKGRKEQGERAFLMAVGIKPDHFGARYNLGVFYADQGRTEEAIE